MKLSKVLGVKKANLRARVITLGLIITGILSIVFGVVTFYGQNAGNFVMALDNEAVRRRIVLSLDGTLDKTSTRLMTEPLSGALPITYNWIKFDEIGEAQGDYIDPDFEYLAFTFYIINNGTETVDINYHIRITDVYNNADEVIRIAIVEDGAISVFQKEDKVYPLNFEGYPDDMPETTDFLTEETVMRGRFTNFKPADVKKFSIVMWLEGYDPDSSDQIIGGRFKSFMNFVVDRFGAE
ncbi:MAG: hypothetical protein WC964_02645 [Acholeplasmataceae bacterium]